MVPSSITGMLEMEKMVSRANIKVDLGANMVATLQTRLQFAIAAA